MALAQIYSERTGARVVEDRGPLSRAIFVRAWSGIQISWCRTFQTFRIPLSPTRCSRLGGHFCFLRKHKQRKHSESWIILFGFRLFRKQDQVCCTIITWSRPPSTAELDFKSARMPTRFKCEFEAKRHVLAFCPYTCTRDWKSYAAPPARKVYPSPETHFIDKGMMFGIRSLRSRQCFWVGFSVFSLKTSIFWFRCLFRFAVLRF